MRRVNGPCTGSIDRHSAGRGINCAYCAYIVVVEWKVPKHNVVVVVGFGLHATRGDEGQVCSGLGSRRRMPPRWRVQLTPDARLEEGFKCCR